MSTTTISEPTTTITRDSKRPRPEDDEDFRDENSTLPIGSKTRETKRLRTQGSLSPPPPSPPPPPPTRALDRIPSEIWAQIFAYCLPQDDFFRPNIATAPLLLGRVSKLWRDISIQTPILWSCLEIRCGQKVDGANKEDADAPAPLFPDIKDTRRWLDRAKATPLSIKFTKPSSWLPLTGPKDSPEVLDLIFGTMKQWKAVYLSIPEIDEKSLCNLLEKHGGAAPLLETFLIDTGASEEDLPGGPPEVLSRALWNLASSSPSLTSLSILGISSFIGSSEPLKLDGYSQLTTLDLISQISAQDALSILQAASNIERCSLSSVSRPRAVGLVEHLVLPRLKDLRFQGVVIDSHWCGSFESILANVTAPMLSTLYLSRVIEEWPQSTLLAFLQRSQCKIQTLGLLCVGAHSAPYSRDPDDLIQLFSVLPDVENLWLDIERTQTNIGMTPREVKALGTWSKETKSFAYCPNLRVFVFSCRIGTHTTYRRGFLKSIASMVSGRWKRPGRGRSLRRVVLDISNHPLLHPDAFEKFKARFEKLSDAGLEVEWEAETEFDKMNALSYTDEWEVGKWRS